MHDELEPMVHDAGLAPMDVLRIATAGVPAYFHRQASSGAIEPGQATDLVLLDANPVADIRHLRRIHGVMTHGRWFDRAALDDLLVWLCRCRPSLQAAKPLHCPSPTPHQSAFALVVGDEPIDAAALLGMMDRAGSKQGVVLSMGYSFADERKYLKDPETLVSWENDWAATQVAVAPERLRGFCRVNPLTAGALEEIERCNRLPGMAGLKLHFGDSGVSLHDAGHAGKMRQVFALANRLRMPITVHLRSRGGTSYGASAVRLFLELPPPMVPDVMVQIAHLAGTGPGHSADADEALLVFVAAIAVRDPRTRHLVFDATTVASADASPRTYVTALAAAVGAPTMVRHPVAGKQLEKRDERGYGSENGSRSSDGRFWG